ncbi:molybdopterin converting factor subunit 1 [Staphylococcus aureus]|nr:molybdopterin converting factor subunit 1 [Staphylococcus aureus]
MKVLYFAEIKDILQKAQEDIVLEQALTVEDLLFERYPQINNKKFQVAVNEEFVQKSDFIQPNDTVALIPPVSGG